jgi:hypothetical protein
MVIFMFNMINRIANAYDLQPEWNGLRSSKLGNRIGQAVMASGLPYVMPLQEIETADSEPTDFARSLQKFGFRRIGNVWREFEAQPRLAIAIEQLLIASGWYCEQDNGELDQITKMLLADADPELPATEAGEPQEALQVARILIHEPYRFCRSDREYLAANGWSQRRILDLFFRAAMLAGVSKINSELVDTVLASIETG